MFMRPFKRFTKSFRVMLALAVMTTLSLAAGKGALAQEKLTSTAKIDAISYQPIPPGAHLETQPDSQSQMDDDAWRQVDSDLAGRGFTISNDGAYVVTVSTQLVSRLHSDRSVATVNAQKSDPKNAALFSTEGNTLLNPNDPVNTIDRIFRVSLTVYERASGHYVWRGNVERADATIEPATAMREMLPALLDRFGETAKDIEVPITE